jgi:hypothetical protein
MEIQFTRRSTAALISRMNNTETPCTLAANLEYTHGVRVLYVKSSSALDADVEEQRRFFLGLSPARIGEV